MISLLLAVLVVCIVIWATRALLSAFNVPDPLYTLIFVVVVVICLIGLIQSIGLIHIPVLR